MKRIYAIIAVVICALTPALTLRAEEEQKNSEEEQKNKEEQKGFFVGIDGGVATGVSTFKSLKPSIQMNLEGGYRFSNLFSLQLGLGGGMMDINPQSCCSAHQGINNERNSYWRAYGDEEWHYYRSGTADGWWYADMAGKTSYYKGVVQANFNLFSFFTDKVGFEISPRIGGMITRTTLSGKSSLTGSDLSLENDSQAHLLYGGETTLSYKFGNGIKLGVFGALDMLTGKHFDNIPLHVHKENYIWNAGIKIVYLFGKKQRNTAAVAKNVVSEPVITAPAAAREEPEAEPAVPVVEISETIEEDIEQEPVNAVPEFAPVYFDNDNAVVSDSQKKALLSVAQYLKENSGRRILICGYSSNIGAVQYNKDLSERRCLAVKQLLEAEGIEGSRIDINPCGIDYKAESAEAARRVEIIVVTLR